MTAQFDLGLWNVWIAALPLYLASFIIILAGHREALGRMIDSSWYSREDKRTCTWCMLFFYGYMICSLFVPFKLHSPVFHAGMVIYMLAFTCSLVAHWNYVSTPLHEPVVRGVYRFSRNPLYFFTTIGLAGLALAAGSWPLLLLVAIYSWLLHLLIRSEEKYCLAAYGDAYRQYLQSVPRYLLFRTR